MNSVCKLIDYFVHYTVCYRSKNRWFQRQKATATQKSGFSYTRPNIRLASFLAGNNRDNLLVARELSNLQSAVLTQTGGLTAEASCPVKRLFSFLATKILRQLLTVALCATLSSSVFGFQAEEIREWKSADGKISIRGKLIEFDGSKVRMQKEDGSFFTTSPESLSDEDRSFLDRAKPENDAKHDGVYELPKGELSVGHLKALERKLIMAKDVLNLYQEVKSKEKIGRDSIVFVDNKIKHFTPLAAVDGIDFGDSFIAKADVSARKTEAETLVEDWISQHRENKTMQAEKTKTELLKKATRLDPSSTQAAMIEGMYYYFYERDYKKAMRSFKDASLRGERYLPISTDQETNNYIAAMNASAIMAIRSRNIDKAYEYLDKCLAFKTQLPPAIGENVRRIHRYGHTKASLGITFARSDDEKFRGLLSRFDKTTGGSLGWFFIWPHSSAGPRNELAILLGKFAQGVKPHASGLEDHVCLLCEGLCVVRCPNTKCTKGVILVPEWRWVPRNDGSGGEKRIRLNLAETCPTCRGKNGVKCWGCDGNGKQEK